MPFGASAVVLTRCAVLPPIPIASVCSGGSHGFVIGHVCPEAQEGGPIALVQVRGQADVVRLPDGRMQAAPDAVQGMMGAFVVAPSPLSKPTRSPPHPVCRMATPSG